MGVPGRGIHRGGRYQELYSQEQGCPTDVQCLYCGKRTWAGWGKRSSEFCSAEHEMLYHSERSSPSRLDNVSTFDLHPADIGFVAEPVLGFVKTERDVTMPGAWYLSAVANRGAAQALSFKRPSPHAAGEMYRPVWLEAFGQPERRLTAAMRPLATELPWSRHTGNGPAWLAHGLRLVRPAFDRAFPVRVFAVQPARAMFAPEERFRPGAVETLASSPVLRLEREKRAAQAGHSIDSEPTSKARWLPPAVTIAWPSVGADQFNPGLPRAEDRLLPASAAAASMPAIRVDAPQPFTALIQRCEPACPTSRRPGCRSTGARNAGVDLAAPPTAEIFIGGQSRGCSFLPSPAVFFVGASMGLAPSHTQVRMGSDPRCLPISSAFPMEVPQIAGESFAEQKIAARLCLPVVSAGDTLVSGFLRAAGERTISIAPEAGNAHGRPVAFGTLKAGRPAISDDALPAAVPKHGLAVLTSFLEAGTEVMGSAREAIWREPRPLPMDSVFGVPESPSVDTVCLVRRDWVRGEIPWTVCPLNRPAAPCSARGAIAGKPRPASGGFRPDAMATDPRSPRLRLETERALEPSHQSWFPEPVFRGRWAYQASDLALPAVSRLEHIPGLPQRDSRTLARPEPAIPGAPAVRIGAREPLVTTIRRREPRPQVQAGPEIRLGDSVVDHLTPAAPRAPFVQDHAQWAEARKALVPGDSGGLLELVRPGLPAGRDLSYPLAGVSPPMDTKAGLEQLLSTSALCFCMPPAGQAVTAGSLGSATERKLEIYPDPPDGARHNFAFEAVALVTPMVEFRRSQKPAFRPASLLPHALLDDRSNAAEFYPFARTDNLRKQPGALGMPSIVSTTFTERSPGSTGGGGPVASALPPSGTMAWEHALFAVLATSPSAPRPADGEALPSLHQVDQGWPLAGPMLRAPGAKVSPHRLGEGGDCRRGTLHYAVPLNEGPLRFRDPGPAFSTPRQMQVVRTLAGLAKLGQPKESVADSQLWDLASNLRDITQFSFSTKKLPRGSFGCTAPGWRRESDFVPLSLLWQRKRSIWDRGARWKVPVNLSSRPSMNLPLLTA